MMYAYHIFIQSYAYYPKMSTHFDKIFLYSILLGIKEFALLFFFLTAN